MMFRTVVSLNRAISSFRLLPHHLRPRPLEPSPRTTLRPLSTTSRNCFQADIRADDRRRGIVELSAKSDWITKAKWTNERGAIFLPNIGDSRMRCSKMAAAQDMSIEELANCHDASDDIQRAPQYLAPIRTVPMHDISGSATATVSVPDGGQRPFVRIFQHHGEQWTIVHGSDIFSASELRRGLCLGIDARDTRRPDVWDGRVSVRLTVHDRKETSTDSVELRVAPVLVHNHLDKVEQIWSTAGDDTSFPWQHRFNSDLASATGNTKLPSLYFLDGDADPWVQDFFKPGFASMPGPNGPVSLRTHIRSSQDTRLSGNRVFSKLRDTGVGAVQYPGGARDEINSMGNLDCTPPFIHNGVTWPAGRIVMGRHGPYEPHVLPYLRAQETQDPILLDAAWLFVGHVDEFVQFLPVDTERGWVVVVADPEAGLQLLQDAQEAGHGELPMYSRKTDKPINGVKMENVTEKTYGSLAMPVPGGTITEYLQDDKAKKTNLDAGERIRANIDILKAEIGLNDAEIYRLPVLFNSVNRDELPFIGPRATDEKLAVVAAYPATINGLVLTGFRTYIAPNPWGPVINGKDIMAEATKGVYEKLGWNVKFIDNWNSHHSFGGEVHCATNTIREMGRRWWA
jgi:protein-arginine deiminase